MSKCCIQFTRVLVFIFNLIFMLLGLALIAVSVYLYVDQTFKALKETENMENMKATVDIILFTAIGIGGVTVIVSSFGMCGAYHESSCLLGTYFFCLLLLVAIEVAAGICGFFLIKDSELEKTIGDAIKPSIENYMKGTEKELPLHLREMQKRLKCCGANSPADYAIAGILTPDKMVKVTTVCDLNEEDKSALGSVVSVFSSAANTVSLPGCAKVIVKSKLYILIAFFCIAGLEVLAMVAAMFLCCFVRSMDSGYIGVNT